MNNSDSLVFATEVVNGKTVEVIQDTDPQNPREWDNEGLMICFHGRYNLGDKTDYKQEDYESWAELAEALKADGYKSILPLYLIDHSGISMRTSGFNDRWDSGQVGFIASKEEGIEDNLQVEVEIYDQYIQGDVYAVRVFHENEAYEYVGGFFSVDDAMRDGRDLA